ncbi:MAG TPA: hypothetical protein VMM80_03840 [Bacteroidota bacterium]|nr:hypothetical protein [Bacteroidota bacterium]
MHFGSRAVGVLFLFVSAGFIGSPGADDRNGGQGLKKTADDTDRNFTTVGNIALTVTNFGTIGTRNAYWPDQPSCEYPRGSRIEHLYQGGLWFGAVSRRSGQQHVTTGATDQASSSHTGRDYEFSSDAGAAMVQRSTLSSSQYFSEDAISHQDFVALYSDIHRTNPTTGDTIPGHTPLGIAVRQESYAWNFPFADFFVILNYTITNVTSDTLDSVYVGFWNNAVVRNTNNVRPGTTGYFNHGGNGYADTLRMMYTFDFDGIPAPPPANSYVGVKLLGATPFPHGVDSIGNLRRRTYYNAWIFRSSGGDLDYFSPLDDAANISGSRSRYDRLAATMPQPKIDILRTAANNITTLISTGPFASLLPGDSLNVVFGVICGRKNGTLAASLDTRDQRKTLYANAAFCQKAYQGEDVNGNGALDPGEDLNGNGRLDHYQLPQPPRPPKVRVEVGSQQVTVYWDKSTAETSVDPVTGEMDFEGYRVYRSSPGADFTDPQNLLLNLTLVGDFDVAGDGIGFDTGFNSILLPQARYFPGDTVGYWYRFPPAGADMTHLNGWQYVYGVSAYDRGDSSTGVTSLESKTEMARVIPGTPPAAAGSGAIGVYPNPYYAHAVWDGSGERNRKIYFYNLPERCEIRIYTLAGDIVAEIQHDGASYDGNDIAWFRQFAGTGITPRFSGGEHAWDLITKYDQAVASGLYLFSVRDAGTGKTVTGKFLIIK